jgi:hypothetical protein
MELKNINEKPKKDKASREKQKCEALLKNVSTKVKGSKMQEI